MFIQCEKESDWRSHTLIVPAVCVGNVGQLTADLLISTLPVRRVGYLYSDLVLPLIGNDPFATADKTTTETCKLVTSIEVYESAEHKLVIVQQRAPLVKGRKQAYVTELSDWIKAMKFNRVVVLTSSFAHERLDCQLSGSQFRYMVSPLLAASGEEAVLRETLSWRALERKSTSGAGEEVTGGVYLPGGGIALPLLRQCCDDGIPAVVLLLFCAEGDNAVDAIELATHLNDWLRLVDLKKSASSLPKSQKHGWRVPTSWRLQYGNDFSQTLFY